MNIEFELQSKCPNCFDDKFGKHIDNTLTECYGCGLVYASQIPTEAWRKWRYNTYADDNSHAALPRNNDDVMNSGLRRKPFADFITKIVNGGTLLDIGCAWGAFLLEMQSRGFRSLGLEQTFRARIFGNGLGLDIRDPTARLTEHSVAVITAIHSLEHLPLIGSRKERFWKWLETGGYFAGIVPNFGSAASQKLGARWRWRDPQMHMTYFTPGNLRTFFGAYFRPIVIETRTGDGGLSILDAGFTKEQEAENNANLLGEEIWFIAQKL